MDHIFVMISMVEKALKKSKGKLYVAFVDNRKAYDSVKRNILWDVLRRAGAGGKMVRALRAMYSSVVASVRVEAGRQKSSPALSGSSRGSVAAHYCSPSSLTSWPQP